MYEDLVAESKDINEWTIQRRRELHRIPETKFEENDTQRYIEEQLRTLGLEPRRVAGTGIVADLRGKRPGEIVALRADMDALPIQEATGLPFQSEHPGRMHACGHDGHMAMLLGAAKLLSSKQDQLRGTIRLVFQPGEEGGGGAQRMIDAGAIEGVGRIFGLHVWPELSAGLVATRSGTIMAGADAFTIRLEGKGGHAANPIGTIDATAVAADIYNALHKLVTRETALDEPAVLSIPMLKGSESFNVIPGVVELSGTLRTTDRRVRDRLWGRMEEIVAGYSTAWRCAGSLRSDAMYYPPTVNHESAVKFAEGLIPNMREAQASMVSEDFAFYLEKIPGAFFFLGMRNEDKGTTFPLHHPEFLLDEEVFPKGVALHAALALSQDQ